MARKSCCLLAANMTMSTGAWDNGPGIAIAGFGVSQFGPPTGCLCRSLPNDRRALTFGPSMTSAAKTGPSCVAGHRTSSAHHPSRCHVGRIRSRSLIYGQCLRDRHASDRLGDDALRPEPRRKLEELT